MEFLALRSALIATANELNDSGINQGTSGNLSGEHNSSCKPSSEWRFHRDIYVARDDAGAIVHTHSVLAVAEPELLSDTEMDLVIEKFKTYAE